MLDKLKAVNNLKKIQNDILKQSREIFHTEEKSGIKVLVRGDKTIEKIEIDGEEHKLLKILLNEALKEVEKKVEKKAKGQASDLMQALGLNL